MELILLGVGGCASYDVVNILQKSRQQVSNVECQLSAKRADSVPAVYTDIHLHFVVTGSNIKATQVEKAVQLSADKYCSKNHPLAPSLRKEKAKHCFALSQDESYARSARRGENKREKL